MVYKKSVVTNVIRYLTREQFMEI